MFTGGRPVDTTVATLFGLFNVMGCAYAWWYIARKNKQMNANLIEAETKQWQMDTLLSVAVMAGFISAWAMEFSPWAHLSVYADPMMMILMSVYFIKVPTQMLIEACKSLLRANNVTLASNS
jgi:predicted Co/Zn/Cd cation transporter (cation efflux family)